MLSSQQDAILAIMKTPISEEANMARLTVRLPRALLVRAKIAAAQDRVTLQGMVNTLLEDHLKQRKGGRSR